jgi:hypothetical protein
MKSVAECLLNAARCETKAKYAETQAGRSWLLDAAKSWRLLAEEAAKVESAPVASTPPN